jgi:hypothetical protein
VVVGLLALRDGRQRREERDASRPAHAPLPDFTRDREVARLTHMSADERAWETACLQRQQAQQARVGQRQDATGAD